MKQCIALPGWALILKGLLGEIEEESEVNSAILTKNEEGGT